MISPEKYELAASFLKSFNPKITLTRSGMPAIICSSSCGDDVFPLLGVYWTGGEWIPIRWTKEGTYLNSSAHTGMDVILEQDPNDKEVA